MGEVAVLHPQVTPMKSRRPVKFNHHIHNNPTNHPFPKPLPDPRRQTPSKSVLKNRTNTHEAASNTNDMVMGQVKILKRGESLPETSKNFKDSDRPTISIGPENSEVKMAKKKVVVNSCSRRKVEALKSDRDVVSSTRPGRLGSDPKSVSKNIRIPSECFAGSVFSDSPSPSSVPLPGFNLIKSNSDATIDLHRILGFTL